MDTMDGMGENARAVQPRKGDNEWWTSRAYECRDKRAVVGTVAPEGAAQWSHMVECLGFEDKPPGLSAVSHRCRTRVPYRVSGS